MIECDEIISIMDITSITKKINIITTNVSINSDDKKVRDCHVLHSVLLLLSFTITCYHYSK